jgi:hypothetical protein
LAVKENLLTVTSPNSKRWYNKGFEITQKMYGKPEEIDYTNTGSRN